MSRCCETCGRRFNKAPKKPNKPRLTHGMVHTPVWESWASMRARCDRATHPAFHRYGGRGISYDPKWAKFEEFFKDMGLRPLGTSLDRIDNSKGYGKENCRWATANEQANNRTTTLTIPYQGKNYSATNLAKHLGLKTTTLLARIKFGRVIDAPVRPRVKGGARAEK